MDSTAAYFCQNCRVWVAMPHNCPPREYYGGGFSHITFDSETVELLKRIADALEKIASKVNTGQQTKR
jgi:hypothetical protein